MAYLMHNGYKVSAVTFQEEAFPEFEQTAHAGNLLSCYYHLATNFNNAEGVSPTQPAISTALLLRKVSQARMQRRAASWT